MHDATLCECHFIQALADMPGMPVTCCPLTNTYHLDAGETQFTLSYCFCCGGRLPERDLSWRPDPDEGEAAEVERLMAGVRTASDLLDIVGPPDNTFQPMRDELTKHLSRYIPVQRWRRQFRYSNRWPSLYLDVIEHEDGSLEHMVWGKSECDCCKAPKKRWWQFWR